MYNFPLIKEEVDNLVELGFYYKASCLVNDAIFKYGKKAMLLSLLDKYKLNKQTGGINISSGNIPEVSNYEKIKISQLDIQVDSVLYSKPQKVNFERPSDNKHYIFNKVNFIRKKIKHFNLEDVYLSIDMTKKYRFHFYLFDSNKEYIPALSEGPEPFIFKSKEDIVEVDDEMIFLEDKFTKFNVCHLLFDKIPRYYEFKRTGKTGIVFQIMTIPSNCQAC